MQTVSCSLCNRTFTRHDNWKRHHRLFHGNNQPYPSPLPVTNQPYPLPFATNQTYHHYGSNPPPPGNNQLYHSYRSNQPYPPPVANQPYPHYGSIPPPPPPQSNKPTSEVISKEPFTLKHPFTMIVSGPTMSGKTTWMKTLLLNRNDVITPPPERILWMYKRWQPLYEDLRLHIPKIQFIQNLPSEINDDAFFNIKERTFVIIDNMMKDATENKDVCELFIEGAHHRNLSVACIMQNLYNKGKGNRTMNLNTQYLVVFKNPRDQLQIAALARQMFPGNSRELLDAYERAVEQPHGSLLIDFKQSTPESHRLCPNILNCMLEPKEILRRRVYGDNKFHHADTDVVSSHETDSETDNNLDESEDDTSGFDRWINEIWEKRDPEFQTKVGELICTGELEDTARERVKQEMMKSDRKLLLDTYSDFLRSSISLMNCALHKKIRHYILSQINLNDKTIEDAISHILSECKHDFDVLFNE